MPPTPAEAMKKNEGQGDPRLAREVRALLVEAEKVVEDYIGEPLLVRLSPYLSDCIQGGTSNPKSVRTMDAMEREVMTPMRESGWNAEIDSTLLAFGGKSYWSLKLTDPSA
jgi:hypothetical protein